MEGVRVLVAEDEPLIADAVAEWLRRDALAVDVAYDGDAALERLGVNEYDVLILDRDLPGVSGDEVCQAVVESGGCTRCCAGPARPTRRCCTAPGSGWTRPAARCTGTGARSPCPARSSRC